MEEIEVKFININPEEIEQKLLALGAVKKYDRVFKDRVFDFQGWPLDANYSWLRLRDKGDKITLSYKHRFGIEKNVNDGGMEEVEIVVDDFTKTTLVLEKIGMVQKFNEEKRRIHFDLDGVDIDIDTWPLLDPYLEIEGQTWEQVQQMAEKLGLKWEDRTMLSAMQIYKQKGIDEKAYAILTFDKQIKRDA